MSRLPNIHSALGSPITGLRLAPTTPYGSYPRPQEHRRPIDSPGLAGPSAQSPYGYAQAPSASRAPRGPASATRSSGSSGDGLAWQGSKFCDLTYESQLQIETAAKNLSSWENLEINSIARGEVSWMHSVQLLPRSDPHSCAVSFVAPRRIHTSYAPIAASHHDSVLS
jgi:hypothetical protein